MDSKTALPPPTSISRQGAGHLIGQLFLLQGKVPATSSTGCLLQGLCRSDRLLAVCYEACAGHFVYWLFAARPVPVGSSAGCFCYEACAGHFICRPVLLQRPCFALPCRLPLLHLPHFCPLFITMCARIIAQAARTALLAGATRDCTGGPCTAFVHCIHFKRGRPWTVLEQPGSLL